MQRFSVVLMAALFVAGPNRILAQAPRAFPAASGTVDAAGRAATIDALISELHAKYVFPAKAAEVETALRRHLASGSYAPLTDARDFAQALTRQLQEVTSDKHLRVMSTASATTSGRAQQGPDRDRARTARENGYGLGRTEILPGNIGYLEIRSFGQWVPDARDSVGRLMSKLADTDALVIDLRNNGGGSPQAVAFVSSYLFGDVPVHLNSLYFRPADRTDHFYTDPRVPGRKFGPTKPVYVLASARTFSAAEEFSYNLQALGRAVIVGENTGGGAHPGGSVPLGRDFTAFIPTGRAINPITKTNWEGVGIKPEIVVPRDKALDVALDAARKKKAATPAP